MGGAGADFLTVAERSDLMRRVRSNRTQPELAFTEALRKKSLKFETNCADLPGKPDIVLRRKRLAIFVDGEFWHGIQWQKRGLTHLAEQFPDEAKRRTWLAKIRRNRTRDFESTATLLHNGWTVLRFWDSELARDAGACVNLVTDCLAGRVLPSPASLLPSRDAAEFFAGIGLARVGLTAAGWTVRFANDNAPAKIAFYKENHNENGFQINGSDIRDLRVEEIPTVALATACFPCTDVSIAGAQRGIEAGKETSAYLKFTDLLSQMSGRRPPLVLLENVVGIIGSRGGTDFEICLSKLDNAGYTVDAFIVDAKSFVPQSRPRLFVVGIRKDLCCGSDLRSDDAAKSEVLRPHALTQFIAKHPHLPWAIRRLPAPDPCEKRLDDVLENIAADDGRWWNAERKKRLFDQMSTRHQSTARDMMKSKRPKYGTVFRRMRGGVSTAELRTDGIAGCLRTPKGGSARQILLRASKGNYAVRLLTPRECARLMGADDIKIPPSLSENQALFAFGDAVCVPAISWIAENYLTPLVAELLRGRVLRQTVDGKSALS